MPPVFLVFGLLYPLPPTYLCDVYAYGFAQVCTCIIRIWNKYGRRGGRWTVTLKLHVATAHTALVSALLLHHAKND
jgi:hypothetical protein